MFEQILHDPVKMSGILAVLVFALTQGLKWVFVKPWTGRLSNERAEKSVNTVILLLPFILGCAAEYVYSVILLDGDFDLLLGVSRGTASIAIHSIFEHFYKIFTGKGLGTYTTPEAVSLAESIAADGKMTKEDASAVQKFLEKTGEK